MQHILKFIILAITIYKILPADDPVAGKTIMTDLLIKELIARDDSHHCLIVCSGSLAEQWQDELFGITVPSS